MLVGGHVDQVGLTGCRVREEQVPEVLQALARDVAEILALLHQPVDQAEHGARVADRDGVSHRVLDLLVRRAEELF